MFLIVFSFESPANTLEIILRGYFGIGVESVSKSMNVGSLFRSAHAFHANFVFTVNAQYKKKLGNKVDTSNTSNHLPFYEFPDSNHFVLPDLCQLVGIELTDDATDLPSFRHPLQAAYILGPERGSLSSNILMRCEHIVRIPTKFCINVGLAGAITMYDRLITLGKFVQRPEGSAILPKKSSSSFDRESLFVDAMARFRQNIPESELKEFLTLVKQND